MLHKLNQIRRFAIVERLYYMIFFSVAFMAMGQLMPQLYYKYLDRTIYYQIENPVSTDKQTYIPGELIQLSITRISKIDAGATAYLELVLIGQDRVTEVDNIRRPLSLNNTGKETIDTAYQIPGYIGCGKYYIRGSVVFTAKGIERTVPLYTDQFEIIKGGI